MFSVLWTSTRRTPPSRKWEEPKRRERSSSSSMNSCQSSARSRKTRTRDATRTSLSVWNFTTRLRTAPCSALSCPTHFLPLVSRLTLIRVGFTEFTEWYFFRWAPHRRWNRGGPQGLHGPRRRGRLHPLRSWVFCSIFENTVFVFSHFSNSHPVRGPSIFEFNIYNVEPARIVHPVDRDTKDVEGYCWVGVIHCPFWLVLIKRFILRIFDGEIPKWSRHLYRDTPVLSKSMRSWF